MARQLLSVALCLISAAASAIANTEPGSTTSSSYSSTSWWDSFLQLSVFSLLKDPGILSEFGTDSQKDQLVVTPPVLATPCSIQPLAPVEDATALQFEAGDQSASRNGLTRACSRALALFTRKIVSVGGTIHVTSAWRPAPYQAHLQQVWDKWMVELKDNTTPSCSELRNDVASEFTRHGLLESQRPAGYSDHTRGTAFDAIVSVPVRIVAVARRKRRQVINGDTLALSAGLRRPLIVADPVHYRLSR